jgi:hypothetical protein
MPEPKPEDEATGKPRGGIGRMFGRGEKDG